MQDISPKKFLIFLDIDGTILDERYRCNYPKIALEIDELEKTGNFVFALNSNRSLEDLKPIVERFYIEGPLICENGLFIYFKNSNETKVLASKDHLRNLRLIKHRFKEWVLNAEKDLGSNVVYEQTDTVKAILLQDKTYPLNSIVILDNKFRKYTVSAHVKRQTEYGLMKDLDSLGRLQKNIAKMISSLPIHKEITITNSQAFGNLLIYSAMYNKRTAVEYLVLTWYNDYKIIAIGDEPADAKMIEGIGEFWTVGNASVQTKKIANKITDKTYARGVHELLDDIPL